MRRKRLRKFRLQSAMEYLMTYGWAILIISVVLGVLFQMGVFNSSSLTVRSPPGACKVIRTSASVNLVGQCSGLLPKYVAQFDGASSYVNAGNGGSLNLVGPLTISVWINPSIQTQALGAVVDKQWANGYSILIGGTSSVNVNCYYSGGGGPTYYSLGKAGASKFNQWTQITYVFTTSMAYVYINGVLANSKVPEGNVALNGIPLRIGLDSSGANYYYDGLMSNVQIYNTSLDASSVAALYQEGIGGAPVNPQYLVGWWPLNGDANDYSGNNDNGAPTGVTYISQYGK